VIDAIRSERLPMVSVVVPAFNEQELLPDCLKALMTQDYPGPHEIIVVDNASTDATAQIAADLGAQVLSEPHPGVTWARERGTRAARGDIVVSTDADTTTPSDWLSAIVRTFAERPELVAVCGPCVWVDAPWWGRAYGRLLFGAVRLAYVLFGRVLYASATNIAFRRDAWSGYDLNATQGGDEVGLLRQLRSRGAIFFSGQNATFTSPRRLTRGLVYNLFVTCFYYYLLGYALNRVAGRTVIGTAPHIRADVGPQPRRRAGVWKAIGVAALVGLVTVGVAR
jgi:glycosyltransferase involved in cell wall biosynthesis